MAPFSYRDGNTFLEMLADIQAYVTTNLPTDLDTKMASLYADFQTGIANAEATINADTATRQTAYDTFVANTNAIINSISNRVGPVNIQRITLTAPYTLTVDPIWPTAHPILFQVTQDGVGSRALSLGPGITGNPGINPAPNTTTEFRLTPDGAGTWKVSTDDSRTLAGITAPGSSTRGQLDLDYLRRGQGFVRVADYGAAGDGATNDTAAILTAANAAVAAGVPLFFNGTKRYVVDGLVFPAGLRVQSNGCVFVKLVNTATYALRTADSFHADVIKLELTGGPAADAGLYVGGNDTVIDRIKVTALTNDQLGTNALFVGSLNPAAPVTNTRLNNIVITGFRSPMRVLNVTRSRFSNATITNFITGVYVIDTTNTEFDKFTVTGTSPSAVGTNGENGMLMEAQAADYSCSDIRFTNWIVDGSPEHAYRIGGSLSCSGIIFDRCVARNAANAGNGTVSTGGASFKALGVPGHLHQNLRFLNCTAEDSNIANGINNFAQFHMGFIDGLTLLNVVVRKRARAYAGQIGLLLNGVSNAEIINPAIRDVFRQAVYIMTDSTNTTLQPNANIRINGGYADTAGNSIAVQVDPTTGSVTDLFIDNLTVSRGTVAFRAETPGAGGTLTDVLVKIRYINAPTGSSIAPVSSPNNLVVLDYTGPVYGAGGLPSADGGQYLNLTDGKKYIRKVGAWVQQ